MYSLLVGNCRFRRARLTVRGRPVSIVGPRLTSARPTIVVRIDLVLRGQQRAELGLEIADVVGEDLARELPELASDVLDALFVVVALDLPLRAVDAGQVRCRRAPRIADGSVEVELGGAVVESMFQLFGRLPTSARICGVVGLRRRDSVAEQPKVSASGAVVTERQPVVAGAV